MTEVFISYARSERAKAERVNTKLEALGVHTFFDVSHIQGGDDFPLVIDRAVKSAKVVLGCWSKQAFGRAWVMKECRVGYIRKVLVPIAIGRFSELDVPTEFSGVHLLDLSDWHGEDTHTGWIQTVGRVERLLGRKLRPASVAAAGQPAPTDLKQMSVVSLRMLGKMWTEQEPVVRELERRIRRAISEDKFVEAQALENLASELKGFWAAKSKLVDPDN